jgi:hypothetical protein
VTEIGRCATCRFWDGETTGPPDRLGDCLNDDVRGSIAVEDVGVGFVRRAFVSDGTFGCTEHEPRTPPLPSESPQDGLEPPPTTQDTRTPTQETPTP